MTSTTSNQPRRTPHSRGPSTFHQHAPSSFVHLHPAPRKPTQALCYPHLVTPARPPHAEPALIPLSRHSPSPVHPSSPHPPQPLELRTCASIVRERILRPPVRRMSTNLQDYIELLTAEQHVQVDKLRESARNGVSPRVRGVSWLIV